MLRELIRVVARAEASLLLATKQSIGTHPVFRLCPDAELITSQAPSPDYSRHFEQLSACALVCSRSSARNLLFDSLRKSRFLTAFEMTLCGTPALLMNKAG
jgi:hypothetical protein